MFLTLLQGSTKVVGRPRATARGGIEAETEHALRGPGPRESARPVLAFRDASRIEGWSLKCRQKDGRMANRGLRFVIREETSSIPRAAERSTATR